MYTKQKAIQEAITSLKKAIGKKFLVTVDMFDAPPDRKMGDIAFPCFELAKGEGRNPVEIATELAASIGPTTFIEKIIAVGPYVNFHFNDEAVFSAVLEDVKRAGTKYGFGESGKDRKVLVEYAQPNTHKEFHVGHIRNAVLGQAVLNILKVNGYETVGAAYIGDIGAHVAKALWGFQKFQGDAELVKEDRTKRLQEIYTEATTYVAEHEEAKAEIDAVQRDLEAREDEITKLWKETRQWSIQEFERIFELLHVSPDVWYYESEVEEGGKELVKKMLTDGIAKKSEGATIVDLEAENLGAFLILKTDGSSLYATKDLALAYKKDKQFSPDRQIFVVDNRQSLYFKQLFATLKLMGFQEKLVHLAYDMVNLPEGAMSSRAGNIVTFNDLHQTMVGAIKRETAERHPDWSEKQLNKVAETVAISAINFMMLRQDPNTIITFDMAEALSFDGFTGPYILYTIARIESIKAKTKIKPKYTKGLLTSEKEEALIRTIADYPLVIQKAGQTFNIASIAQWAFDTAKMFAEYYHEVRIVEEEDKVGTSARLALIDAVRQTLDNACEILGMETLKEM
ncbi:arginine--tRNA ligase [Candidatus Uhrbacteria bacterium CG_4_10_14_0_2_um_filter_41_7]|uniref:Arginine--tRNA ligase n=1 Tax=Candidatus Uhrbacteria bacterium CG_4_9_14_3_um_filter_41_35 TaxID=1975034 RepID=A0A2M7XGQ3_9BACT|nr:MAG: arginine--tRNA ligase [Candidatus Uhrbacteria bacterium CG_4_10_14_0_2_um_filter_41_7]PJA46916.1 MAG: arginine--tRNA ligase [Candidatus Uhrbacteria bacterium CG_4_9_14_3_um_filter_41_35]